MADASNYYADIALQYANAVLSGQQVACKWVKLACKRHLDDLARWGTNPNGAGPFYFDAEAAYDMCDFTEKLPHIEGSWSSDTVVLEPWQVFCLSVVFGWRRKDTGRRRFTKVYWEMARKQGKSFIAAAVALYCLTCEGENAPYIYVGATTGAQALKVFHPMRQIAMRTPALLEAFGLRVWSKSITTPDGGYAQPINSKASNQDGHNGYVCVLDELHAHKDRGLYDVLDSSQGARKSPLMWIITTAGFDVQGVCYEQRSYSTKILENVIEADHYFGIIYTIDDSDDAMDPSVWVKANPNLGVSVTVEGLEAAANEAKAQPGKLFEFLTKRMSRWTSARAGHINIGKWRACDGPVDLAALRGVKCWGGLDLGNTSDLTSFRLAWLVDGRLKTWGVRYLPEAAVGPRSKRNGVPYQRWQHVPLIGHDCSDPVIRQALSGRKLLTVTPGDVTDYSWIERDIRWAMATFNIAAIGFDSWNASDVANRLMEGGANMVEVRQGFASLTAPMRTLDRLYLGGMFDHGGDEILSWCASNVVARRDENGNEIPGKKLSAEKIDDFAALIDALAVSNAKPGFVSRYDDVDTRDLLVL